MRDQVKNPSVGAMLPDRDGRAAADTSGRRQSDTGSIASFIELDRLGAICGIVLVVVVNGLFIREPGVWLALPVLAMLAGALTAAKRLLASGRVYRSLIVITAANWLTAICISALFPFLWPVMALTVLMPLVAATPFLGRRRIRLLIGASAVAAALVAVTGLLLDDEGVIEDLDDTWELVVVIGALGAQIVPIGLTTWHNNRLQLASLNDADELNRILALSTEELNKSRRRIVAVADEERSRIERDLHDGAQQRLVALGMRLRLLESQVDPTSPLHDSVTHLLGELDATVEELREVAHGIYPPVLQARGLSDALEAVRQRSPAEVRVNAQVGPRYAPSVEIALYYTALEAITNSQKHSEGADVSVTLATDAEGDLILNVTDAGPGFDVANVSGSRGLVNMADRIAAIGGTLQIDSRPGSGTTINARVPASDWLEVAPTQLTADLATERSSNS